jgi:hypothetical protein
MQSSSTPSRVDFTAVALRVLAWLASAAVVIGRGLAKLGRLGWQERRPIVAIVVRVAFWSALALWLTTAVDVVGGAPLAGALVCAVAVVLAVARHVRWASWALGSLHGASATVLWLLVTGTG